MKTKKIKACKMWKSYTGTVWANKLSACMCSIKEKPERAYVLPADADSIERMIEQIVSAMSKTDGTGIDLARAALAAIGITSRAPKS